MLCRKLTNYVANGGYASHGNSITAKCAGIFKNLYKNPLGCSSEAYTVYTNSPKSGAMRAFGVPQSVSFAETFTDDLCFKAGLDPYKLRMDNLVEEGFKNEAVQFYTYDLKKAMEIGKNHIKWEEKREKIQNQTENIRHGVGMCCFIYQIDVYPISLETAGVRMIFNQDGSMQIGATEIVQGADTVFSQIAAETLGITFDKILYYIYTRY